MLDFLCINRLGKGKNEMYEKKRGKLAKKIPWKSQSRILSNGRQYSCKFNDSLLIPMSVHRKADLIETLEPDPKRIRLQIEDEPACPENLLPSDLKDGSSVFPELIMKPSTSVLSYGPPEVIMEQSTSVLSYCPSEVMMESSTSVLSYAPQAIMGPSTSVVSYGHPEFMMQHSTSVLSCGPPEAIEPSTSVGVPSVHHKVVFDPFTSAVTYGHPENMMQQSTSMLPDDPLEVMMAPSTSGLSYDPHMLEPSGLNDSLKTDDTEKSDSCDPFLKPSIAFQASSGYFDKYKSCFKRRFDHHMKEEVESANEVALDNPRLSLPLYLRKLQKKDNYEHWKQLKNKFAKDLSKNP